MRTWNIGDRVSTSWMGETRLGSVVERYEGASRGIPLPPLILYAVQWDDRIRYPRPIRGYLTLDPEPPRAA